MMRPSKWGGFVAIVDGKGWGGLYRFFGAHSGWNAERDGRARCNRSRPVPFRALCHTSKKRCIEEGRSLAFAVLCWGTERVAARFRAETNEQVDDKGEPWRAWIGRVPRRHPGPKRMYAE